MGEPPALHIRKCSNEETGPPVSGLQKIEKAHHVFDCVGLEIPTKTWSKSLQKCTNLLFVPFPGCVALDSFGCLQLSSLGHGVLVRSFFSSACVKPNAGSRRSCN